jgi:hypothetical protein
MAIHTPVGIESGGRDPLDRIEITTLTLCHPLINFAPRTAPSRAISGAKFDDVCAVILRAVNHHAVMA